MSTVPKITRLDKPARPDAFGLSDSPVGMLLAAWQDGLLTHLQVLPTDAHLQLADIMAERGWDAPSLQRDDARTKELVKTMLFPANEWHGRFPSSLNLGFHGTDFQFGVMQHMLKIPAGKTASYGMLSALADAPRAARAAGSVCAKNPICLIVPCHRVLGAKGAMGGYAYGTALKRQLLAWESQERK